MAQRIRNGLVTGAPHDEGVTNQGDTKSHRRREPPPRAADGEPLRSQAACRTCSTECRDRDSETVLHGVELHLESVRGRRFTALFPTAHMSHGATPEGTRTTTRCRRTSAELLCCAIGNSGHRLCLLPCVDWRWRLFKSSMLLILGPGIVSITAVIFDAASAAVCDTGVATDSARMSGAIRRARVTAKPCRRLFTAAPLPALQYPGAARVAGRPSGHT